MSMSHASARPDGAVPARRPRRTIVALGVAAALTGGGLIAAAPHASAAPAATTVQAASSTSKAKPSVSLKATKKTLVKGSGKSKRPVYTVTAKRSGKAVAGKAKLVINGKVKSTKSIKRGKATFNPNWAMHKLGKNKVRVVVDPSSSKLGPKSSRTLKVTAKKPGSPVVAIAKKKVGSRYVSGATGPNAFDCSGFTSYVYKKAIGKKLPRSSSAQKNVGKRVSRANAKPGDLIWSPGHVAVYVGNGKQIDAGNPRVGVSKRGIWQSNPVFIRVSSKAV